MVLSFSIWLDGTSHMIWLDGTPKGADKNLPLVSKGPCSDDSGNPDDIKKNHPNAYASYSNIKTGPIGSTF